MANRTWTIDDKEVGFSEGAVVRWDSEKYFSLEYNGKTFFGEIMESTSDAVEIARQSEIKSEICVKPKSKR